MFMSDFYLVLRKVVFEKEVCQIFFQDLEKNKM